jgi:hypothetical protein
MLREVKAMHGTVLLARDGEIGKIEEVLFDDQQWTVRYLVVSTGGWLSGRKVLLPPAVLEGPFLNERLNVNLTRGQVERSPVAETDEPVSRQWETDYHDYYGWPYYWGGMGGFSGGIGFTGGMALSGVQLSRAVGDAQAPQQAADEEAGDKSDVHLRSTLEVTGYKIEAQDGPLGHIADFIVDDETWNIRYLAADTGDWWPGKKFLLPPDWIKEMNWPERRVEVRVTRDQVQNGPEWNPHAPITPLFEGELFRYDAQQHITPGRSRPS